MRKEEEKGKAKEGKGVKGKNKLKEEKREGK